MSKIKFGEIRVDSSEIEKIHEKIVEEIKIAAESTLSAAAGKIAMYIDTACKVIIRLKRMTKDFVDVTITSTGEVIRNVSIERAAQYLQKVVLCEAL